MRTLLLMIFATIFQTILVEPKVFAVTQQQINEDPQYQSGRKMLLSGILITSIGVPVGLVTILSSAFGDCFGEHENECIRRKDRTARIGAGIAGLSAISGVGLIVWGAVTKHKAKRELEQEASSNRGDLMIGIDALSDNSLGLSVKFAF